MKQIINRGSFLTLMFLLLGCLSLYAADNDLITRQITIKLEKAGTLPDRIASSRKYKITNLKIIGEINGTDLRMIREMAGSNSKGDYTDGKLSVLDLSEAKIVGGGDYYYCYNVYDYKYCHTSNDAIDSYAFYGCRRLTSLTLPAGITGIGYQAFWYCSGLTSLTLPAGIGWIGDNAFNGCSGLKEVRFCINDNLDTYLTKGHPFIGVNCDIKYYINDKEITSIEIPSNVTTLGNYVFQGCSGLTSLTLPDGITSIGSNAFRGCSGLTSLTLPDGITSIGHDAFYGCSGLTSLTLPDGITSIGSNAFQGCSGLTSLILPAGITEIGGSAFKGCSGLTSIYVSAEKVPKIGSNVFVGVGAKKCTLYVPMGTYSDYLLSDFGNYFENIVELEATCIQLEKAGTLPDRIASSKKYHIANLKIIGEINGTDLWMIREMAGRDARGYPTDGKLSVLDLSEAKIVEGGGYYYDGNYNDYYTSNDVIGSYAFQGCSGLTSLNLPAGITSIGSYAFQGCSGLTSLTLPDGITWIGDDAFRDCSGLTSLNLPDGITSIGDRAFKGCSGLTSLNLPDGITEIGWYAFQGCSGLTSIYVYAEKVPKIGGNVFEGIDAEKCTLYVPMGTYDDYRLSYIGSFFKYILEFDATGIDKITINLKKAGTLPDRIAINKKYEITNLKIIGEINGTDLWMIREMARSKLSVLDLSEAKIVEGGGCYYNNYYTSNDVIGPSTFEDCSGLTSLTLPAGITEIGDFAFWGCSGLTSLTLPAGITSIGYDAFYGCSGLTSLTLPDGITEIGIYAFKGCSGLTSLTLPDGITWIGHDAFKGCSGLTSIYVYAEKVPGYSNVFEGVDAKKCTLYVPMGTRDDYLHSLFGTYFENIVEFDATGIDKTTISTDVEEVARYSVNGQRLSAPTKGLNIVKYSDGSVKKVAVQ